MTIRFTLVYCKIFLGVFYTTLLDTILCLWSGHGGRNPVSAATAVEMQEDSAGQGYQDREAVAGQDQRTGLGSSH